MYVYEYSEAGAVGWLKHVGYTALGYPRFQSGIRELCIL